MNKKIIIILSVVLVAIIALVFGKPETYNECIEKNMKGVTSDRAAVFIRDSCREKHPKKLLTDEEVFGKTK